VIIAPRQSSGQGVEEQRPASAFQEKEDKEAGRSRGEENRGNAYHNEGPDRLGKGDGGGGEEETAR